MASASAFSLFGHHSGSKGTRITTAVFVANVVCQHCILWTSPTEGGLDGRFCAGQLLLASQLQKAAPRDAESCNFVGESKLHEAKILEDRRKPIAPDILTCPKTGRHAPLDPLSFWPKAADAHAPFACPAAGAAGEVAQRQGGFPPRGCAGTRGPRWREGAWKRSEMSGQEISIVG